MTQKELGIIPATVLPLCSRVIFTICAGSSAIHLSVLKLRKGNPNFPQKLRFPIYSAAPAVGLAATMAGITGLLWTDDNVLHVLNFMFVVAIAVSFFAILNLLLHRRKAYSAFTGEDDE